MVSSAARAAARAGFPVGGRAGRASPQLGRSARRWRCWLAAWRSARPLIALSLGHWYLVAPTLSVRPLIQLTFLCLGAVVAQIVLLPLLLLAPGARPERVQLLFSDRWCFSACAWCSGCWCRWARRFMTWRTARIRSLDSATGLLYIVAALILAGEIAARTLFFLTGVARLERCRLLRVTGPDQLVAARRRRHLTLRAPHALVAFGGWVDAGFRWHGRRATPDHEPQDAQTRRDRPRGVLQLHRHPPAGVDRWRRRTRRALAAR